MSIILETTLALPLFCQGKVRDTYELGNKLLMVATDRISAFDDVLPCGIPDKGIILNQISAFWFKKTVSLVPNHLIEVVDDISLLYDYQPSASFPDYLAHRSMIVHKAKRIPVECVVRGYLSGSAWTEYKQSSNVFDLPLPRGLRENQELPKPLFTPTTKAESGHDQPLDKRSLIKLVGKAMAQELKEKSLLIYKYAQDYAKTKGIIIADTKFEFGLIDDKLVLIDELLTPDSSRFWDASQYVVGRSQPSLDKQPVRDWLLASGWNKEPPAPKLPPEIIGATTHRYREAYRKLTGGTLFPLIGT